MQVTSPCRCRRDAKPRPGVPPAARCAAPAAARGVRCDARATRASKLRSTRSFAALNNAASRWLLAGPAPAAPDFPCVAALLAGRTMSPQRGTARPRPGEALLCIRRRRTTVPLGKAGGGYALAATYAAPRSAGRRGRRGAAGDAPARQSELAARVRAPRPSGDRSRPCWASTAGNPARSGGRPHSSAGAYARPRLCRQSRLCRRGSNQQRSAGR